MANHDLEPMCDWRDSEIAAKYYLITMQATFAAAQIDFGLRATGAIQE